LQKGKKRAKNKTSPSYPLWSILERTYFGSCNLESNIQEEETSKRKTRQHGCYGKS